MEKATEGSLMRKTKSQLVDIILRKDRVEVELSKNAKEAEKYKTLYEEAISERNQFANTHDKLTQVEAMYNATSKKVAMLEAEKITLNSDIADKVKAIDVYKETINEDEDLIISLYKRINSLQIALIMSIISFIIILLLVLYL